MKTINLLVASFIIATAPCWPIPDEMRAKGFVYLHEVDPTILVSLRYSTDENFVGKPIDGYKKPVVIMTNVAAQALKRVQAEVNKDGYSLVVYDAYRPQHAVDHFVRWSEDSNDCCKQSNYYPRISKANVFDLKFIMKRSGHSRGSRVDVTLIKVGQKLHKVVTQKRTLLDGSTITFLDDGTVDMGSSFDLFDTASHYENNLIADNYKKLRTYLKNVMERHGFENYAEEWWHFSLKNDPLPTGDDECFFNFPIE